MCKDNLLVKIFIIFFKVGLFTIGGGIAMIPVIKDEFCDKAHYLKEEEMIDIIAIIQSTPGVMAANIAAFVGYSLKKTRGALIAVLGAILPSFIIVLIIASFYSSYVDNIYVTKAFRALHPAIAATILVAGIDMAKNIFKSTFGVILAVISGLIVYFFSWTVIYMIIAGAAAGIIYQVVIIKDRLL